MSEQWTQERPRWCPHTDCVFQRRAMDAMCGGELPESTEHDGGENTHRFCLNGAADDGGVFDLQVNATDLDWLRWIFDALDGKRTSWLSGRAEPTQATAGDEPEGAREIVGVLVDRQAEDEGLWFDAETATEAYLQKALRQLHAAVEGDDKMRATLTAEPPAERYWGDPKTFCRYCKHIRADHSHTTPCTAKTDRGGTCSCAGFQESSTTEQEPGDG